MTAATIPKFYSITEIANILHVHKDTARDYFGPLKGVIRFGESRNSRMLVPEYLLLEWMTAHGFKPQPEPPTPAATSNGRKRRKKTA